MTYFGDQSRLPDIVAKDNTPNARLDELAVTVNVEVTDQDELTNKYAPPINVGNKSPGVYWDDENAPGTATYPPAIANNRSVEAPPYMENNTPPANPDERTLGEWSDCTPCVARDNGVAPILSTNGNVDPNLQAKEMVNGATANDPTKIKSIVGYPVPKGMPGIAAQAANQRSHENFFVPAGGMLTTSQGTQNGLSTRVIPVDDDGWLEEDRAAALDSLIIVNTNEDNQNIPTINATLSTNDNSGYGAMTFGDNNLAYLSNEVGGPIHPGFDNDKHAITPNTSGHNVNPAAIDTSAKFAMDVVRDSQLNFTAAPMPALTPIANPDGFVEAQIYHDNNGSPTNDRWRIVVPFASDTVEVFARIRWNFSFDGDDMSEAQLMQYNQTTDQWTEVAPTGLVWIDTNRSLATKFETAGDNTIFKIRLVATGVDRDGTVRDLYCVDSCKDDRGHKITHVFTQQKSLLQEVDALILSEDLVSTPWTNTANSKIQTTINGTSQDNNWAVRVPKQWDLTGPENYDFLEVSDLSRSLYWFAIPIEPINSGVADEKVFESAIDNVGTIATYKIK